MPEKTGASAIVIVGGGVAGGNAAVTLREGGFRGRVVIINREPGVPFGRPPLSKGYLLSEEDLDGWYVRPVSWYEEHDVELFAESSALAIDAAAHTVVLGSSQTLRYDKLLIATGGRNRPLEIPGAGLSGNHYLRTVADCDVIKREAVANRRAVVVGMGFMGCELAASLTRLGVGVSAVFPGRVPLERVLGAEVGALIGAIHRANGVELLAGDQIAAFEGTERLEAAVTASGNRVTCDFAVIGVGIEPDVPAVAGASLALGNGILADELCRTSAADVYAAGDVANHLHPLFGRIRVEHCSARPPPMATSIVSGPINTNTKSSMSAMPPRGTRLLSAGAWMRESSLASTYWTDECRPPLVWTAAVIRNWTTTARWRPAHVW